ncbi:SAVED domain-containing protein [Amycolatopsis magusensis]|uniref:SAVED domain-containing protein n=1 Tax=Amycolatopsis magusensis TaxID=882444 RepID=UPI0024A940A1|nr:SAVED domain-containing protein [Amycolatopsis magusensis]MDI5975480.1 SAVED domain-containing protein [Amycolatopsis magusensis]
MPRINDLDPIFISYRHSDGDALAERAAWVFRAHGVPVWHDQTHLPPGRFQRRLQEALDSGLSGAVLLVTEDMAYSSFVRELELPELLRLEADSSFTFAIGNTITSSDGRLDYGAPDRLLPQEIAALSDFDQFPVCDHAGLARLAGEMAIRRVRRAAVDDRLHLDIQTRTPALGTPKVPLATRTRPPLRNTSVPPAEAWEDFAPFLGDLPRIVQSAGVQHLHITGGAHLSMAFALGAALPTTTGLAVTIADQEGNEWTGPETQTVSLVQNAIPLDGPPEGPLAVYLDLVPAPPNKGFRRYAESHPYAHAVEIAVAERQPISATAAPALITELRRRIGEIAGSRPVHLFMRVPFPLAVMLGRACNTLRVTLYEWEREAEPPTYLEMATVSAGRSGGPVVSWTTDRLPAQANVDSA